MQNFLETITTRLPAWAGALLISAPFIIGVIGESAVAEQTNWQPTPTVAPITAERLVVPSQPLSSTWQVNR